MSTRAVDPRSIVPEFTPVLALKVGQDTKVDPVWHQSGYARADLLDDEKGPLRMRAAESLEAATTAAVAMSRHQPKRDYLVTSSVVVKTGDAFAVAPVYWQGTDQPEGLTQSLAGKLLSAPGVVAVADHGKLFRIEEDQQRAMVPGAGLGWVGDTRFDISAPAGKSAGYGSVEAATKAARKLSAGGKPGLAVLRREMDHYELAHVETSVDAGGGFMFDRLQLDTGLAKALTTHGLSSAPDQLVQFVDGTNVVVPRRDS